MPVCCGSDTASLGDNAAWRPTGNFSRPAAGSSLLRIGRWEGYPAPARVIDLVLKLHRQNNTAPREVRVEFTAPGAHFDLGTGIHWTDQSLVGNNIKPTFSISAEMYEIRFSTSRSTITSSFDEASLVVKGETVRV